MLNVEREHNPGIINDTFIMLFCFSTGLLVGFYTLVCNYNTASNFLAHAVIFQFDV